MKKGILLLVIMSFFITEIFAQQENMPMLVSHPKIELGLQGLGVGYEFALGGKTLIDVNAGLGGGYTVYNGTVNYEWGIIDPAFYMITEFRYYYSLKKRLAKNRNRGNNAGNYVGAQIKYATPEVFNIASNINLHNTLLTEVHWGIQRNLGKKFLLNLHLGLGYAYDYQQETGGLYIAFGLKFGLMF